MYDNVILRVFLSHCHFLKIHHRFKFSQNLLITDQINTDKKKAFPVTEPASNPFLDNVRLHPLSYTQTMRLTFTFFLQLTRPTC